MFYMFYMFYNYFEEKENKKIISENSSLVMKVMQHKFRVEHVEHQNKNNTNKHQHTNTLGGSSCHF